MRKEIYHLVKKEFLLEWRSKYAINGILIYLVSTIFVCYLSFRQVLPLTWNALFWIILLFAAINALTKSFALEGGQRLLYYYTLSSARGLFLSKIIYNALLMILLSVLGYGIYSIIFPMKLGDPGMYFWGILLGAISFSNVFTMISAIASKANNNATLMSILSFPVILPLLILLIKFSKNALDGLDYSVYGKELLAILGLNLIVLAMGLLLFPYLWRD